MQKNIPNRLIHETSPYLLQHAYNPVDWFPWGEEALIKAQEENKVILVSIGYAACHWCHVMEKESFEKPEIATIMNDDFVCIKIDREERPDIDHIYMDAVQLMTGSGGWPLNVFLTPDKKPFYGGTYFPPVNAFNRASWTEVLNGVANAWQTRKAEVQRQAQQLTDHLEKSGNLEQFSKSIVEVETAHFFSAAKAEELYRNIMKTADKQWGGFGQAPKFPQTFTIRFLLQYHYFTGDKPALEQALLSIDKMLDGGIYDQLGGGMARYSTDTEWLAPHFEKMLYDNALLITVLCDAYQLTKREQYAIAIRKTIGFVQEELLHPAGGFYAALDADSEGIEGKYYVWSKVEVDQLLKQNSAVFCAYFDITENGNWEGKNICRILKNEDLFIKEHGLEKDAFDALIDECTKTLLAERAKRVKPALDDKIILSWNALMIKAIAAAGVALGDQGFIHLAEDNFAFLEKHFRKDAVTPELMHTFKQGIAKYPAFLDDYATIIECCIELHSATMNNDYLEKAQKYCEFVTEKFGDEEGIFFYFTGKEQQDVLVRKKEIYDGANPSGNALMAANLQKLSLFFDRADWRLRSEKMLASLSETIVKYPGSFGIWASLLMQNFAGIVEIAIVGKNAVEKGTGIGTFYIPNKIMMVSQNRDDVFPLLRGKLPTEESQIYVCKNYTCNNPVTSIEEMFKQIKSYTNLTVPEHNN